MGLTAVDVTLTQKRNKPANSSIAMNIFGHVCDASLRTWTLVASKPAVSSMCWSKRPASRFKMKVHGGKKMLVVHEEALQIWRQGCRALCLKMWCID